MDEGATAITLLTDMINDITKHVFIQSNNNVVFEHIVNNKQSQTNIASALLWSLNANSADGRFHDFFLVRSKALGVWDDGQIHEVERLGNWESCKHWARPFELTHVNNNVTLTCYQMDF